MTRRKVQLAFIVDAAARKATYKKRSKSVLKKVEELSTLCGIEACGIVYGPYEPEPEIWPSHDGVHSTLMKFMSKTDLERSKKKFNQEAYTKQRISKAEDQVTKLQKENRKNEIKLAMYESFRNNGQILNSASMNDLNDLSWLIDHTLKDIDRKLEDNVQLQMAPPQLPPPPPPAAPAPAAGNAEMAMMMNHGQIGMTGNNHDNMQPGPMNFMMNGNGGEEIPFAQPHDGNGDDGFWNDLDELLP